MQGQQDIRHISNPFERVFNVILPDKNKFYSLLMRLISQFFTTVKLPTLNDYASNPKQATNDISAYSGANGYLYMLIRLSRYFRKQRIQGQKGENVYNKSFIQFSKTKIIQSDMQLNKLMDPQFYLTLAYQQYELLSKNILTVKPSKHLSFYMSQVCTWVCGMHIGYDTKNHVLFKQNQTRLIQCYHMILDKHKQMMWQLLYGITGFLYAILQIQIQYDNKQQQHFRTNFKNISTQLTKMIINKGIQQYQTLTKNKFNHQSNILPDNFRLVYYFHKKQYLGGAHGLGGILNILLISIKINKFHQNQINLFIKVINSSIIFLLKHFINSNFSSSNSSTKTKLIHFCHGSPGILNSLARFLQIFPQHGIKLGLNDVIQRSLDHIWKYGVLRKGFGLCHGISGNAYVFLSKTIHNILPERAQQYHKKAILFALLRQQTNVIKQINTYHFKDRFVTGKSDNPFSLMLGIAGDICFVIDAFEGQNNFPGFNIQI